MKRAPQQIIRQIAISNVALNVVLLFLVLAINANHRKMGEYLNRVLKVDNQIVDTDKELIDFCDMQQRKIKLYQDLTDLQQKFTDSIFTSRGKLSQNYINIYCTKRNSIVCEIKDLKPNK